MVLLFPMKPAQEPPVADLQEDAAAPPKEPAEPKACSLVVKHVVSISIYIYLYIERLLEDGRSCA